MRPYRERFSAAAEAESYDAEQYAHSSHSSFLWELQQPVVRALLERQRALRGELRLLDFACGTGRILSFVENFAGESDGVDISPAMLERAAQRCARSRLLAGDIVEDQSLAPGPYDVITTFRFLLNAEPGVRRDVLDALRVRLAPDGLLIANVHGNATSLRHISLVYRRWESRRRPAAEADLMLAEMSPRAARELFASAGFEVVEQIGFGILPHLAHRSFLRPLARAVDRQLSALRPLRDVSVDLLFVCRPSVRVDTARSAASADQSQTPMTTS